MILALALVFLVSLGGLAYDQAEYRLGEQTYDEAAELFKQAATLPEAAKNLNQLP